MARMSIKQRVTLFYATVLILIILLVSAFFLVTLDLEIFKVSQTTLETTVKEAFIHVRSESDWLEVSSDFVFYVHDVTLVLYGPAGTLINGSIPAGFPESLPLVSDEHQSIKAETENWQVYDLYKEYPNGTGLWVRGIYSLRNSMESFRGVLRIMAIGLPVVLVLAILMGYFITRRAFSPISRIQATAEEIARNRDLSRRIALESGTKDELYKLSQVFDSMFAQIETAFNNEKQFTSDVSHELRTPISVIISQAEYGLAENLTTNEYKTCLEAILAQGEKTSQLISSLLEISRAANTKTILAKETLNLADLCDAVIEEMSERAEERGIRLITRLDRYITINGDQTQLLRLIINLVSNAITHGKDNGFVMLQLFRDQGNINLSVSDDGVGIAPENLDMIFNRFFQVNPARSRQNFGHSGLGLPIVKMIAEAHGGSVTVQSTLGVGSTFVVSFPDTCHVEGENQNRSNSYFNRKHFHWFRQSH
jgi:signal transduction histidine kinase